MKSTIAACAAAFSLAAAHAAVLKSTFRLPCWRSYPNWLGGTADSLSDGLLPEAMAVGGLTDCHHNQALTLKN